MVSSHNSVVPKITNEGVLQIPTARAFQPLYKDGLRFLGAKGGRGSAKSHWAASYIITHALTVPGSRILCTRETQKSLRDSAYQLIVDKIRVYNLEGMFIIQRDRIITPNNGYIIFMGLSDNTSDSVKSLEDISLCWVEEAHTVTQSSLRLLSPSIRADNSKLLFTWNPTNEKDAVDVYFRDGLKVGRDDMACVHVTFKDNPWFPDSLEAERAHDEIHDNEFYSHVWLGAHKKVYKNAYFADALVLAENDNRIAFVPRDPLLNVYAFWDIGGTGQKADATSIWIVQFVGFEIRVLSYYESKSQPLVVDVEWLKDNSYDKAICYLPHDGGSNDKVFDVSYQSELTKAGFKVIVIPNQGKGAAMQRVEAVRRIFSRCYFNEATTGVGRNSLGAYRPNYDEKRDVDLGPVHDWASHGADAFGLMACCEPEITTQDTVEFVQPMRHMASAH